MKKWVGMLLVLIVPLMLLGCQGSAKQEQATSTSATEAAKEPFKVGAIVSVTGPSAPLGEAEKKTLLLEVEKINAAGGIDGHKIDLFIQDDQSEAKNAVLAVSKLIDEQGVIAIIGGTTTPCTMAIKDAIAKAQIPQMAMAAGIPITKAPNNEWVFRTAQSDAIAVQKVIGYMSTGLKIKKFAIIHDANSFGQSGATELQNLAPKAGLTVVKVDSYKTDDTNMSTQLTKIKGSGAEAVVVWGTNPGPAIAAKNMKELGMTIPYIGSHGIGNKKFIELAGNAAEGVVFPAGKVLVPSSASGEQQTVIQAFLDDYKAKYGEPANSFAGHAYDAINILTKALEKAGSGNEKLRTAITDTKNFNGISGIFSYAQADHDGLKTTDMVMVEIKNGAWQEKK